jgi:hypothetical protein
VLFVGKPRDPGQNVPSCQDEGWNPKSDWSTEEEMAQHMIEERHACDPDITGPAVLKLLGSGWGDHHAVLNDLVPLSMPDEWAVSSELSAVAVEYFCGRPSTSRRQHSRWSCPAKRRVNKSARCSCGAADRDTRQVSMPVISWSTGGGEIRGQLGLASSDHAGGAWLK